MEQKTYNLFGLEIKRKPKEEEAAQKQKTFALPDNDDGAIVIQTGAYYGTYLNLENFYKNDIDLINRYRDMAIQPEMETAINEIVNESIVPDQQGICVSLNLDKLKLNDSVKKKIINEFNYILRLMNWGNISSDLFRRWYVDGRLFFHVITNEDKPNEGIKELRYIDPRRIRKIREVVRRRDPVGIDLIKQVKDYYLYNEMGLVGAAYSNMGVKISVDSIVSASSGLMDPSRSTVLSHLHKSIKPLNMLRMVEDSLVVYRLTRAPERRIFYIDVGTLPTKKAQEFLAQTREAHRNKIVYDSRTGEVRDDRKYMAMQEDIWIPRREGSTSSVIDTLPGAANLSEIDDVIYFEKKLYRSLGIPISRLEPSQTFSFGRANEIQRDEVRFSRFIDELRRRFSNIFDATLRIQLILKGIMSDEDWKEYQNEIVYDFRKSNDWDELKEIEMMSARFELLSAVLPQRGVLFSKKWIQKNILHFTEEEIEDMDEEIKAEQDDIDDDIETTLKTAGAVPVDGAIDQSMKMNMATMMPQMQMQQDQQAQNKSPASKTNK